MESKWRRAMLLAMVCLTSSCTYQAAYQARYVPEDRPAYLAHGQIALVIPEAQREFMYTGKASSWVGSDNTLTLPLGQIVEEIASEVFGSCFADGVKFITSRQPGSGYVLALEGDLERFVYSYTRVIDSGFNEDDSQGWIVPEVAVAFDVRAYDGDDRMVLGKTYDSGVKAGRGYQVSAKPEERINATLHATLHGLMMQVAADVRPLLTGRCVVEDRGKTGEPG